MEQPLPPWPHRLQVDNTGRSKHAPTIHEDHMSNSDSPGRRQDDTRFRLPAAYDPSTIEASIYQEWIDSGVFHARPDNRPRERRYVVMMPLPNVTGALHMGHAMDNSMQDLLVRWHRMLGDNTLWMPGTDHAGIATQAIVEKRLKELEGKTRHDIGREALVERIWSWKDKFQARIVDQLKRLGCSADWARQRFTMDRVCARAVRPTFFRMFEDGLIVRGKRLVNWDPFLRTSISDDEVYHETVQGHFWHLRYPIIDPRPGEPEYVEVATTRPETMLGDTAVAVHPAPRQALQAELDSLKASLQKAAQRDRPPLLAQIASVEERITRVLPTLVMLRDMARDGRQVLLPLLDRPLPLICDEWAKPLLGSGCVKITPAHDPNDYEVWTRHRYEMGIINILEPDGTLNENAGLYAGLDRFDARDRVVDDLRERGLLGAIEDREIEIGHSDRSKTPIEPYLSDQWFVRMGDLPGGVLMGRGTAREFRAPGLVQSAMDAATNGRVSFHPSRFLKTYLDWLGEKRDWPISRQLWWGHRIPVWSRSTTFEELCSDSSLWLFLDDLRRKATLSLRLFFPESDEIRHLGPGDRPTLESTDTHADERCLLDICLLEQDPHIEEQLESHGCEREQDVLDTWFSSALWPHSTLGWPQPASAELEGSAALASTDGSPDCLQYYYPGSCLVTGRDIITLWVARMVITGLYNMGDVPFSDVFIHANILDGKGERMSKSKGNGIDPVDIIDEYGTDSMRYVLADMQTGNQDIRLPVTAVCPACGAHNDLARTRHGRNVFTYLCSKCRQEFDVLGTMPDLPPARLISQRFVDGRRFCNKLWNTARFALGNLEDVPCLALDVQGLPVEDRWILAALNQATRDVTSALEAYNPSAALGAARDFMWGSLCDWYLELIKPRIYAPDDPTAAAARQILAFTLDQVLRLLHPFVPFITEHLFKELSRRVEHRGIPGIATAPPSPMLINAAWPEPAPQLDDPQLLQVFATLQALTGAIREIRSRQQIPSSRGLCVTVRPPRAALEQIRAQGHVVRHMARLEELQVDPEAKKPPGAASLIVGDLQVFVHDVMDDTVEMARLEAEARRIAKEIATCEKKLSNPQFVARAPKHIVQEQRDRKARYQQQLAVIRQSLDGMAGS